MTSVHIQKQFVLLYFIMQNNTPYCMMFSFAAVFSPPPAPGPALTESTSQHSLSLWEAARKWAVYLCVCVFVCMRACVCVCVCVREQTLSHYFLQFVLLVKWALQGLHTLCQQTSLCVLHTLRPPLVSNTVWCGVGICVHVHLPVCMWACAFVCYLWYLEVCWCLLP